MQIAQYNHTNQTQSFVFFPENCTASGTNPTRSSDSLGRSTRWCPAQIYSLKERDQTRPTLRPPPPPLPQLHSTDSYLLCSWKAGDYGGGRTCSRSGASPPRPPLGPAGRSHHRRPAVVRRASWPGLLVLPCVRLLRRPPRPLHQLHWLVHLQPSHSSVCSPPAALWHPTIGNVPAPSYRRVPATAEQPAP